MTTSTTTLAQLRSRRDPGAALAFFDSLPAVTVAEVLGVWKGGEVATGHPLDGMLTTSGWWGKRFDGPEDVHPLVMSGGPAGRWSLDPALVPIGLLARRPQVGRLPGAGALLRGLRPLVGTTRPRARLRATEYRGVVSATMVYDALPILDVFRRVDDATLLGVMDLRGAAPYVFTLERVG